MFVACFLRSPLHPAALERRAKIMFKTQADSGQPWDLAARASTQELFLGSLSQSPSLALSLSPSLPPSPFPNGTWFFVKGTNGNFQLGEWGESEGGAVDEGECEKSLVPPTAALPPKIPSEEIRSER